MIQPRNDRVLIERVDREQSKGGIIFPDIAKEKGLVGIVRAVGPGKWIEGINGGYVRKTMEVRAGDMVLFNSKWNDFASDYYDDLPIGTDTRLHLVQEADIFCKLNA